MKKIFNILVPCLALAAMLVSCNDTMDDKDVYDARYSSSVNPVVTVKSVAAVSYAEISATCTLDTCAVIEEGIQLSTDKTFATCSSVANDTIEHEFTVSATSGIEGETTYYVRAYAVKKDYTIVVSEAKQVTTPRTPIFTVDGVYTATEYGFGDDYSWGINGYYEVTVAFPDPADKTTVSISNIWDGGMTVYGVYDEATQTISVPTDQTIYDDPTYGTVVMKGVNSSISAYTQYITFKFTPLGGTLVGTPWGAVCSAGLFGYCYLDMVHNDVNE